ncbi:MAG: hypothetical protein GY696_19860 [Gammaproteobacteria bacterium]|nr:hypothetical protein [Gammaproteobacteria bacterium]
MDHRHQLLLDVTGVYPVPGCKLELKYTQLDNIYLANLTTTETRNIVYGLPQVYIREINMQRNTAMALEYTAYQLSRQIEAATQTTGTRVSKQQHETLDNMPLQNQPVSLDWYMVTCTTSVAVQTRQLRSKSWRIAGQIYQLGGGEGFVSPHSRLFTPHSSKVACSRYFPLTVQTRDRWVSLMPHLVRQKEPVQLQRDKPWTAAAEDFSAAGLYSQKEIMECQGKMLFPSYRKATLGAVAYGNCLAVGECAAEGTDNIPVYSLAKLSPGTLNPLGVWTRFRVWLREWGNVIALVCIIIFIFSTAANICPIAAAAVRVGPKVAIAVGR